MTNFSANRPSHVSFVYRKDGTILFIQSGKYKRQHTTTTRLTSFLLQEDAFNKNNWKWQRS